MQLLDYLILIGLAAAVYAIVRHLRAGPRGCGGGCAGCTGCAHHTKK